MQSEIEINHYSFFNSLINAIIYFPHSLVQFLPGWMQGMFSFVPFFKIIIIIMRWLWDLAVDIPRGSPSLKSLFLWREVWETNLSHNVGSRALSPLRHPSSSRKKQNFELIVYVTTAITFVLQILTSALMEFMSVSTNRQTV